MTIDELIKLFEEHDEYIRFDRIENPPYPRADICAFIKLHELCGGDGDMVCAAEHDEIFLDVSLDALAEVATEADVVYLQRCGVRVDEYKSGLAMFA